MLNQTTHMSCGITLWKLLREDQCGCQRQLVRTSETSFVRRHSLRQTVCWNRTGCDQRFLMAPLTAEVVCGRGFLNLTKVFSAQVLLFLKAALCLKADCPSPLLLRFHPVAMPWLQPSLPYYWHWLARNSLCVRIPRWHTTNGAGMSTLRHLRVVAQRHGLSIQRPW